MTLLEDLIKDLQDMLKQHGNVPVWLGGEYDDFVVDLVANPYRNGELGLLMYNY